MTNTTLGRVSARESQKYLTQSPRYCLYARKSSEDDERQALSIESQVKEMLQLAEREGLEVTEIRRESHSAKESGARPVFKQLLTDIDQGMFEAILTWAPDRLSRNAGDLGTLVDLMDQGKLSDIRTHGQKFTNSPNEKFLLMILCSQAKLENDNRGLNVKRGLRTKCEMGVRPGCVPLGYKLVRNAEKFREGSKITVDDERAPYIKKLFKYVAQGYSGRQVQEYLIDEGFRTKNKKQPTLSMIYRMLKDSFYYGEFEFPHKSGNWYKGTYAPLISKEEFEEVAKVIKAPIKGEWGRKEFYFKSLFKCGSCGSGITGEDKINRHGKLYVYYRCNKYGGKNRCREKYIREGALIEALAKIIDKLKVQSFRMNIRIEREVEKMNSMQIITNGTSDKSVTTRDYIEYILKDGTKPEKRDVLQCITQQLILKDGQICTA